MQEVFLPVKGFEGFYEISNLGNIKSLKRMITHRRHGEIAISERIRKLHVCKNGYLVARLNNGVNSRTINCHRIVAETFISNPENKRTVNHIDGNKSNNCITNLEWATYSENHQHAYDTGLKNGYRKPRIKKSV